MYVSAMPRPIDVTVGAMKPGVLFASGLNRAKYEKAPRTPVARKAAMTPISNPNFQVVATVKPTKAPNVMYAACAMLGNFRIE
jgi:hypothetical protein